MFIAAFYLCNSSDLTFAQDIDFEITDVRGSGNAVDCDENGVFTLASGGDHSLVLSDFGVEVDNSVKRALHRTTKCTIKGVYTIPKGYFLKTLSSNLSYGVVKTTGSAPLIVAKLSFSRPAIFHSLYMVERFRRNEVLNEPLLMLSATRATSKQDRRQQCQLTKNGDYRLSSKLELYMSTGVVTGKKSSVIINIDGFDTSFDLTSSIYPCAKVS
jgi:hypothetical protein